MSRDDDNFLSRWSKRKIRARAGKAPDPNPPRVAGPGASPPVIPAQAGTRKGADAPVVLPPIDSLTMDSDFTPFLQPGVDPALKREALKKLVRDPRFNVMDGLDVYIDDYSKPDPLPEGWLEKLNQLKNLGHSPDPEEGEAQAAPEAEAALQKNIQEQADRADAPPAGPALPDTRSRDSE